MPNKEDIIEVIKTIIDPELYIDIWTLGLIYEINPTEDKKVGIKMTFTSMACPVGPQLVEQVREKVLDVDNVEDVEVEVVFEPKWEPSEELKAMMGLA